MSELGQAFIAESRKYLNQHYLPKIERCLDLLTEEDIWWRPHEKFNSIGNLLLHLSGNIRQWIISAIGGAEDQRNRQQEFDERTNISKAELLEMFRKTMQEVDQVLAALNPAQLLEVRTFQNQRHISIHNGIYHVVEHFSMHTGQIIMITKLRTNQDLAFYSFINKQPVEQWR